MSMDLDILYIFEELFNMCLPIDVTEVPALTFKVLKYMPFM